MATTNANASPHVYSRAILARHHRFPLKHQLVRPGWPGYIYVMAADYLNPGPSREEIDSTPGAVLLEFGTAWCGHCQFAAPAVADALRDHPSVRHIKVEDGPGRRLGRSFRVKLWPTLIALQDGVEVARVVRPERVDEIQRALAALP